MKVVHFVESLGLDQLNQLKELANKQAPQHHDVSVMFYSRALCGDYEAEQACRDLFDSEITLSFLQPSFIKLLDLKAKRAVSQIDADKVYIHGRVGAFSARYFFQGHQAEQVFIPTDACFFDSSKPLWKRLPSEFSEMCIGLVTTSHYVAYSMTQYLEIQRVNPFQRCVLKDLG